MEQVAKGSCESLLRVDQRKGRLAQAAQDTPGQGLWEGCCRPGSQLPARGITPKHTACCEQLWEASQEEWLLEKQSFLLLSMGLNSQHDAFIFCGD